MPLSIHHPSKPSSAGPSNLSSSPLSQRQIRKNSLQAHWDRFWKNHETGLLAQHRRDWLFFRLKNLSLQGKGVLLGCGDGYWTEKLLPFEWDELEGCDVSKVALEKAKNRLESCLGKVHYHHECFPFTRLPERSYDWVFVIDLIAEIEPPLQRLAINEIARLCKKNGHALISTALDVQSSDALAKLVGLIQTELTVIDIDLRYDAIDVFLEKNSKRWKFLKYLMNRLFFKSLRPGYVTILAKAKSLR